jgi:hypothetical protein
VRFTATSGWYTVSSSQLGHGDSNSEYSWFRSSNGQYRSSITREFRKPPELEVPLDVLVLVDKTEDELAELVDDALAAEDVDVEEELEMADVELVDVATELLVVEALVTEELVVGVEMVEVDASRK